MLFPLNRDAKIGRVRFPSAFHSQIRINVECSFGMLVNRWAVLRSPIPLNISIQKTTSLVRVLCCLHNFLINEKDDKPPITSTKDRLHIIRSGGMAITENNCTNVEDLVVSIGPLDRFGDDGGYVRG